MATAPVSSVLCKSSRPYRKNVCGGNATHPLLRVIRGPSTSGPFSATDWRVDRATFGDAQRHTEKGRTGNLAEQGPARRSECSWPVWQDIWSRTRRGAMAMFYFFAWLWWMLIFGMYLLGGNTLTRGLKPWPRLFHAMRASRETELAKDYPIHVVTAWSGNTPRIAMKHYLQVTDDDFERAAQGGAQVAQNAAQHAHVSLRTHSQETTKAPAATRAYANGCDTGRESATASSGEDRIRTCGPVARSRI